jgi:putative ABC transport system permease protein
MRRLLARLIAVFRRSTADDDFAQELDAHVEMLTEDNIARGMSPAEARRAARIKVGAASSLRMRHRDERGLPIVEDLAQDVMFAIRLMARDRWFSAAAVFAIALGIGANTVGFSIINAAFIRGFAFEDAERLHALSWRPDRGFRMRLSYPDYEEWRTQSQSFDDLAAYTSSAINISDDHAAPVQTQGAWVTANHFDVLRQAPLLGRTFADGEDRRGAAPVLIIGFDIWATRFNRSEDVLGRTLRVNGVPTTIIGVMPQGMKFPDDSELWVPFVPSDAQLTRDVRPLTVFGRLRDGVSRSAADAEIDGIARQTMAAHPEQTKDVVGGQVETFIQRYLGRQVRPMFIAVMGAVMFVLLIACANVANLQLSRATHRAREMAVRVSLGATRWRIIRQLLIESLIVAVAGGAVGLVLAQWGIGIFDAAVQMAGAPYWMRFTIDYRVLLYVAGICVVSAVLFGLAPALLVSRANQHRTLKDGARGTTSSGGGRLGTALVVVELALTVVLLCGAGLMLRSFVALYSSDPGFPVDGLTRMEMQLPPERYPTAAARAAFFDQLHGRLAATPGFAGIASTTSVPPLDDETWRIVIDGRPVSDEERQPFVATVTVTPTYFDVLGVRILRGRGFTDADGQPGSESVILSQIAAERHFPGEDPVGRRIRFVQREDEPQPVQTWRTVVGVSAPFLQGNSDEAFRSAVVYLPFRQDTPRTSSLLVRSTLAPASVMQAVRAAMQAIDPDQPVFAIETVAAVIANERIIYRIFSTLFGVFAGIGLALSAVGIYGVIGYAVTRRTQEIGVRMAMGARRWDVTWMFLRQGVVQLAVALVIGVPAAVGLAMAARFRLVEIEAADPLTIVAITIVVAVVASVASLMPARKAARVDPVIALRAD